MTSSMPGPAGSGPRTVVLISGSGTNLQAIIDEVGQNRLPVELTAVVSDCADAFGLERASKAGIDTVVVNFGDYGNRQDFDRALADVLEDLEPEIVVLAGFMRILSSTIVTRYQGQMLNIHPSLLPKYKGLHTYRKVLAAGDRFHGSTVHYVIPKLDAGPSIIQYRVAVRDDDTEESLATRVQQGEYVIYPRAIEWLASKRVELRGEQVFFDGEPLREPKLINEGGVGPR